MAKVVCMLEAFDFRELVTWSAKRFNSEHIIVNIKEEGKTPMPLTPLTLKRVLHLLEPTKPPSF